MNHIYIWVINHPVPTQSTTWHKWHEAAVPCRTFLTMPWRAAAAARQSGDRSSLWWSNWFVAGEPWHPWISMGNLTYICINILSEREREEKILSHGRIILYYILIVYSRKPHFNYTILCSNMFSWNRMKPFFTSKSRPCLLLDYCYGVVRLSFSYWLFNWGVQNENCSQFAAAGEWYDLRSGLLHQKKTASIAKLVNCSKSKSFSLQR
jgi:hypothetical protein